MAEPNTALAKLHSGFAGHRTSGRSHKDCDYFVLEPHRDPSARIALAVYAQACRGDHPALARDLRRNLDTLHSFSAPHDRFPLNLDHDPSALVALAAYIEASRTSVPGLAQELRHKLDTKPPAPVPPFLWHPRSA